MNELHQRIYASDWGLLSMVDYRQEDDGSYTALLQRRDGSYCVADLVDIKDGKIRWLYAEEHSSLQSAEKDFSTKRTNLNQLDRAKQRTPKCQRCEALARQSRRR